MKSLIVPWHGSTTLWFTIARSSKTRTPVINIGKRHSSKSPTFAVFLSNLGRQVQSVPLDIIININKPIKCSSCGLGQTHTLTIVIKTTALIIRLTLFCQQRAAYSINGLPNCITRHKQMIVMFNLLQVKFTPVIVQL